MSRTDKTRPYWVQIDDPLNNRFKRIGNEWHYKPMVSRTCWCCTNKYYRYEKRVSRTNWRKERQDYRKSYYKESLRD